MNRGIVIFVVENGMCLQLAKLSNFQRITIFECAINNFACTANCCCIHGIHPNDMMQSYSGSIFVIIGIFSFAVEMLRITDSVNENSLEI